MEVSPRDTQNLPEGIRSEARRSLWTLDDIKASDEVAGTNGDLIVDGADIWRILVITHRPEGGYTKAILGTVDERGRNL